MLRYLLVAFVLLLALYTMVAYNGLVSKEEKVEQTWGNVQDRYQRRLDLTPNLVSVVKGMADFEQETLVQITEARSNALARAGGEVTAKNYSEQGRVQDTLAAASNRLIAVIEKYPVLRGTEAFRGLQTQLEGNERRIKVARSDFNAAVRDYNQAVRSFPRNIVAGIFGFDVKEGFAADAGAENNVEIKF
ncbi:LemA family protein [Niabella insulamsoli]|uniref:LemA family protein n=1 Tax=Niabella insulamsoli TaxID=3144874 RepID=UPI003D0EDE6F